MGSLAFHFTLGLWVHAKPFCVGASKHASLARPNVQILGASSSIGASLIVGTALTALHEGAECGRKSVRALPEQPLPLHVPTAAAAFPTHMSACEEINAYGW